MTLRRLSNHYRFRSTRAWRLAFAVGLALLCLVGAGRVPVSAGVAAAWPGPSLPDVTRILARMTVAERIGQMFMVPIDGLDPSWHVGGVILYRGDVASGPQLQALIAGAQRAASVPLLVATDEEGGQVDQIPAMTGVPQLPSPQQYGLSGSADRVYADALASGRALRSLGITMDLAPVLDVLLDANSPIGDRSYGADPHLVARLGVAAIRGYQDAGIAATAKHFLGLGSVSVDLHQGLPVVRRTVRQLDGVELVPMRAAIRAGVDALMVTHAVIPALDPSDTPASLSRRIVGGFIRSRLGYRGLIITDSLAMGGLGAGTPSIAAVTVRAVAAGNDMVLVSADAPTVAAALQAVERAVAKGRISLAAIDAAARRVLELKARLGLLPRPPATRHHATAHH